MRGVRDPVVRDPDQMVAAVSWTPLKPRVTLFLVTTTSDAPVRLIGELPSPSNSLSANTAS
jgi:hypothetical protein